MNKLRSTTASRSLHRRPLRLESLESRELMAGDLSADFWPSLENIDPGLAGWVLFEREPSQVGGILSESVWYKAIDVPQTSLTEPAPSVPPARLVELSLEITDATGQRLDHVQVGDEVQLRVIGRDLRDAPLGLFGAYFDIEYPPGFVPSGPAEIDPYYGMFRQGAHHLPGVIDELGGIGGMEYPPNPKNQVLAIIPMRATAAGPQTISINPADTLGNEVMLHGLDIAVRLEQTHFHGATITVDPSDAKLDHILQDFVDWTVPRSPIIDEGLYQDIPISENTDAQIQSPPPSSVIVAGNRVEPPGLQVIWSDIQLLHRDNTLQALSGELKRSDEVDARPVPALVKVERLATDAVFSLKDNGWSPAPSKGAAGKCVPRRG